MNVFGYHVHARVEFKIADMWVGVFWRTGWEAWMHRVDLWVCILPCVPLHIDISVGEPYHPGKRVWRGKVR